MPTKDERISIIKTIHSSHLEYWNRQRSTLKQYSDIYQSRFWAGKNISDQMVRVETPDAYAYIEGYISSLFSKSPSVEILPDISVPDSKPVIATALCNRFLADQRNAFEDASRQALLYPCSFLKVAPVQSASMLDRVAIRAIPPWEGIVDMEAPSWEKQRYCGHHYSMPVADAKERFGNKQFQPTQKLDFFSMGPNKRTTSLPNEFLYIEIVELYDLVNDELIFWSPNYKNGLDILEKEAIPVRTFDEQPLAPIVPLFYSRTPEKPLVGLSSMSRMYDLFMEKNNRRTYWANAVRKDSRQWLAKRGALDEEARAKLASAEDGIVIEVDEDRLTDIIMNVPAGAVSSNDTAYMNYIEQDLARGSMIAPFARGEATNITATEVTALAQYTASEIGKYARERDQAIERCAMIYLRVLSFMIEEGEKDVIRIGNDAKVVTAEDLEGKWLIRAIDQGNDPIAKAVKLRQLESAAPLLVQLGVPKEDVARALLRAYDLEDMIKLPDVAAPSVEAPVAPPVAPGAAPGPAAVGGVVLPPVKI